MRGGKRQGAGRPKGSINKRSIALSDRLYELMPNYCPLEQLVKIAMNPKVDIKTRVHCHERVATYLYPKPKVQNEMSGGFLLTIDPAEEAQKVREAKAQSAAFNPKYNFKLD